MFAVLFAPLFIALFGYFVMHLWNWLMPALFGWHLITFWQAVGILVMSKILFGGFRGRHGGHMHWRGRMMERWGGMTPEEREKLRRSIRDSCGPCGMPEAPPKA
jgi:Ca2+/H+ antiporter, TMEM165/GDT1 family